MAKLLRRRFARAFKLAVARRMDAGESGAARSRGFGIKRTILYRWRDALRDGKESSEDAVRNSQGRSRSGGFAPFRDVPGLNVLDRNPTF